MTISILHVIVCMSEWPQMSTCHDAYIHSMETTSIMYEKVQMSNTEVCDSQSSRSVLANSSICNLGWLKAFT